MPDTRIDAAVATDNESSFTDYSVDAQHTDGVSDEGLTRYTVKNWNQNLGYYKEIPELRAVIDARAGWTNGKGFQADPTTTMILDTIKGFGKDSFNTILENMNRTADIAGDSFAEIIRDKEGNLINIKPLDPSTIVIVAEKTGIIKNYEKIISKTNTHTCINSMNLQSGIKSYRELKIQYCLSLKFEIKINTFLDGRNVE